MKKCRFLEYLQKYRYTILFTALVMVQILAVIYVGTQRQGLHIDEHYSYLLSNSYDADCISNAPEVWNQWMDGDEFSEFLTVEKGERFAYKVVYENNAKDAHPPLFYFLLHTVCSLFPGVWTPWLGMGMNILLLVLAQAVLYKLSREIMGDSIFALVPAVLYGGMQVFTDTALFIRMYPLMTLLTVLLALQHYRLISKGPKYSTITLCGIFTFLGVFTQYYFVFAAFFMAAAYCIFLLLQKKWKPLFAYAVSMLLGVVLVFVVFPAGITQITGSETNNVGKEVAANILNFSGWGSAILHMVIQMIYGAFVGVRRSLPLAAIILLAVIIILIVLRIKNKAQTEKAENRKSMWILFFVSAAIVALAVIVISHVTGKFLYLRYLYNLFPLVALLIGMALWLIAETMKLNKSIIALGAIVIAMISCGTVAKEQLSSYMFAERADGDNAIIAQCADKPLVMLNNGTTHQPTGLLHIMMESDLLYMADYTDMEAMDTVLSQVDCNNGVVFIVLTDKVWGDGFDGVETMSEITEESQILQDFEEIGHCDFSTAYIALPKK